ncbi:MAG: hypothetical protein Q8Q12_20380 [bacterium]|nr:hypothetical protein [bacterium]
MMRIAAGWIAIWLILSTFCLYGQAFAARVPPPRRARLIARASPEEPYSAGYYPWPKNSEKQKTEWDTLHLRNEDKVSGTIERIAEGVAVLRSEFLAEPMRIPLKNVHEIGFKDRVEESSRRQAKVIFANGDSLSVDVTGYDGERLTVTTDFDPERRIGREYVSGIIFERDARVVYRADFEDGNSAGFKSTSGEWTASRGTFGPSEETEWTGAHLRLRQEGHVRYRWTQSEEDNRGTEAWLSFFARHFDHYAPGEAYQVRSSPFSVTLYRTIQNNAQHVATFGLSERKSTRRFEVEHDSRTGLFRLKVDGEELTAGVFASPIPRGEYVVLGAQAKHRFDDIVIEQVSEAVLPEEGDAADLKDCVLLTNGDRLSGKVIALSEGKARIETGYSGGTTEMPVTEISAVRFGGSVETETAELPVVLFRNGDRLSAEVVGYALPDPVAQASRLQTRMAGSLRVKSLCLGELELDVKSVSSVDFGGEEENAAPFPGSWEPEAGDS